MSWLFLTERLGTIALAISVVAELAPPHERGKYVGTTLSGYIPEPNAFTFVGNAHSNSHRRSNTAPSLGPVLGGVLAERASWRWIFWFLSILSGLCLALIIICLPETARKLVGNGSIPPRGVNRSILSFISRSNKKDAPERPVLRSRFRAPNPISCLRIVFNKDSALVLVANAVFYINYSCMQASLSPILMDRYGLDALQAGLTYLPYGIACGVASFLVGKSCTLHTLRFLTKHPGKVMDHDYKNTAAANGFTVDKTTGDDLTNFPIEKARLRSIWYYVSISTVCTVGYGWTLETRTVNVLRVDRSFQSSLLIHTFSFLQHLAAPLILLFICGLSVTGTFNVSDASKGLQSRTSLLMVLYYSLGLQHPHRGPTPGSSSNCKRSGKYHPL